ncbi:MAG: DUF4129 domain-containing protein, partial [Phycicoccus sp.]
MWHARWGRLVGPAASVASGIALVTIASTGRYMLLPSGEVGGADGPCTSGAGGPDRCALYDGPVVEAARSGGSGAEWVGPVLTAVALAALLAAGLTWRRRRRGRAGPDDHAGELGDDAGPARPGVPLAGDGPGVAGAVEQSWRRVEQALGGRGSALPPWRTAAWTGAAAVGAGASAAAVHELVELYDRARYSQ